MGGWNKPLPKINAISSELQKNNAKWKEEISKIPHLPKQSLKWYALSSMFFLFVSANIHQFFLYKHEPLDVTMIIISSYVYCDFWLWLLHCFLDRKENLNSMIPFIKISAYDFQQHHDIPVKILTENHLSSIDEIILGTSGTTLLLGYYNSPFMKYFSVGVCIWGIIGCLNHYYCHCRVHGKPIPNFYRIAQDIYLLPTSKHHKIHHTSPFETNWNFLNGGHNVYEWVYNVTNKSYLGLAILFYTLNPFILQFLMFLNYDNQSADDVCPSDINKSNLRI